METTLARSSGGDLRDLEAPLLGGVACLSVQPAPLVRSGWPARPAQSRDPRLQHGAGHRVGAVGGAALEPERVRLEVDVLEGVEGDVLAGS